MVGTILRFFFGDLTDEEVKKFGLLAGAFFFVIGTYWLMRPLKDAIFRSIVGLDFQPNAKLLSVFVVGAAVLIYSKLVDIFEKDKLFYIICGTYAVIFSVIAVLLRHPTIGLANTVADKYRILGWVTYIAVESFGSIVIAHFWAFTISLTDSTSAKKGYPIIICFAQIGGILGPFLAYNAKKLGVENLAIVTVFAIVMIGLLIRYFMSTVPAEPANASAAKKPKTGFFEGLSLLLTRPYLFGIFAVVMLYEIVGTIVDFQMKKQAELIPAYASTDGYAEFLGLFGMSVNSMAFIMALLGTSYLLKRKGLVFCLLTFPVTLGIVIAIFTGAIQIGTLTPQTMLWGLFAVMVVAKGLSYALNNPSKEMMYIPTSKDAKFKAKGWIDMFGSRSAKAIGSSVNKTLLSIGGGNTLAVITMGSFLSLGLIGVWIMFALFVGRTYVKLIKEDRIIE